MSEPDASPHDELLARVACGELSRDDAEVRALAETDADFRRRLGETLALRGSLDAAAEEARSDMALADELHEGAEGAPSRASARELVLALADERRPGRPGRADEHSLAGELHGAGPDNPARARRTVWIVLAAAALVVLTVRLWREDDPAPEEPPVILGSGFEDLRPVGDVVDFTRFSWSYPEQRAARFEVEIYDGSGKSVEGAGASGPPIDAERNLVERAWTPSEARRRSWPDEIRWVVTAYDRSGDVLDSGEAAATRSRP